MFCDAKLLCLLTFNSSKTRSQVGIKSEGECETSNPEQVRTSVKMMETLGRLTRERKDALLFLLGWGVRKEAISAHLNMAHLDEKQLIVPETGTAYFGSETFQLSFCFLWKREINQSISQSKQNYICSWKGIMHQALNLNWNPSTVTCCREILGKLLTHTVPVLPYLKVRFVLNGFSLG